MPRYSEERKASVLKKILPPQSLSIAEVSRQEGISVQTLYQWRNKLRDKGIPVPGKSKNADQWSSESKLAVVIETATLSEIELSEYCREKGLYPEQVQAWKQDCLTGMSQAPAKKKEETKQAREDQKRIKKLERELKHKEKALAEAAALLVLRKKLTAFYGEDDGDN